MPLREVHVRRYQVVVAFAAVTLAYVIGLYALHRTERVGASERSARIAALHQAAVDSCNSRHLLAVAMVDQSEVISAAEQKAIRQAKQLRRTPGGYTPAQFRAALANAETLVRKLEGVRRLAKRADCRAVAPLASG